MTELIHIRVFELRNDRYLLPSSFITFEEYVIQELQNGYVLTDMANFTVNKLRVITYYSPAIAKKYQDAGSMVSNNLAKVPGRRRFEVRKLEVGRLLVCLRRDLIRWWVLI